MAANGYGEQTTKVVGGNPQIAQALKIQPGQGTIDQLCEQHLGGYRLIKKLGQGGMGSVYKAEQISLRRDVAIKMLDPRLAQNKAYLERFTSEAKAAAQLNHRNLVQIFDVGESHGVYYFSMEYIDGQDIGQILDRMRDEDPSTIPAKIAIDVMIPIVSALSAAHAIGIIHRDVKPDNIMISVDGTPKLADLGIAKVQSGPDNRRTEVGAQLGTPHYVSPEQARDPASVDPRADIYSLGATMFHMVTGRPPYEGNNPATILRKLQTEPVPLAHELNPAVPFPLSNAIARMMAKIPHERYANTEELYSVLLDLRLQLSNKGGTQKVSLGQGSAVRIEASDTGEIELHLAGEEPAKEEDLYSYVPRVARPGRPAGGAAPLEAIDDPDQYVPSVMRPEGPRPAGLTDEPPPRPPMSRPARPGAPARPGGAAPKPGGGGAPPRAALIAAIGGGGIALVLVGVFLFGGKPRKPVVDPIAVPLDPIPTPLRPPDPPIRVQTQDEIDEERAKDLWAPLAEQRIPGLTDDALEKLEIAIGHLRERYPKTAAAGEAGFRLETVRKEKQERQYRALKASVDAKVAAGEFHAANAEVEAFLAQYKDTHSRAVAVRRDGEIVTQKAAEALSELLAEADTLIGAKRFDEAKAKLDGAQSRHLADGQAKIAEHLVRVAAEKEVHQRLLELDRYPGYFAKLQAEKGLDKWLAFAEAEFKGPMGEVHPREIELADLGEVKGAREAVVAALKARVNKEVQLWFLGDPKPKADVLKACDGDKISMGSRLKYLHQLRPESLIELAGPALQGPEGQLRLAVLLLSMSRDEEALVALEKGRAAAAFPRYQLRFLGPAVVAARNLAGGTAAKKDEDWARMLVAAQGLVQLDPSSAYRAALERLSRTLIEPATKVLRPAQVMRQATLAANAGNVEQARLLCQVVLRYFQSRDEPQAAIDAQRLLDSLAGR